MVRSPLRKVLAVMWVVAMLLAVTVAPAAATVQSGTNVRLLTDAGVPIGMVSVRHVLPSGPPGNLLITYALDKDWRLLSVEVAVESALSGIPVNKAGNPIPGKFDWKPIVPSGLRIYTVTVPISQTDLTGGGLVYLAAHAKVVNVLTGSTTGAWGEGFLFPDSHGTGMYFTASCTN